MSFHSSLSIQKHNSCSGSVCSIFNIITSFTNFTRTWFFIFTRMRITDKLLWAQQLVGGNDNYGDAYEGMSMVRKHGMTAIKDLTRDAALSLALQFGDDDDHGARGLFKHLDSNAPRALHSRWIRWEFFNCCKRDRVRKTAKMSFWCKNICHTSIDWNWNTSVTNSLRSTHITLDEQCSLNIEEV